MPEIYIYDPKIMIDISDGHQTSYLEAVFHAESRGGIENLHRKRFDSF